MTPKNPRTLFVCQNCGFQTSKWLGKCPECEAWSSFLEEILAPEPAYPRTPGPAAARGHKPTPLVNLSSVQEERRPCGCLEFDRALGGGLVLGSVVLLGGDPGIGKSTLMLQVLDRFVRERLYRPVCFRGGVRRPTQTPGRPAKHHLSHPPGSYRNLPGEYLQAGGSIQAPLSGPGLHPDLVCRQPAGRPRLHHPGPGNRLSAGPICQAHQCPHLSHRPCYQRRRHRRPQTPGAHG